MDKKKRLIMMVVGITIAVISLVRLAFLLPGILPSNHEKELRKHVAQLQSMPMEQQGELMNSIFKCCAELGPKSKFAEEVVRKAAKACYDATAGAGKPLGDHGFSILLHSSFAFQHMGELEPETEELLKTISENEVAMRDPAYGQMALQAMTAYTGSLVKKSERILEESRETLEKGFANLGDDQPYEVENTPLVLTAEDRKRIASIPLRKYNGMFQDWDKWKRMCESMGERGWTAGVNLSDPAVDWEHLKAYSQRKPDEVSFHVQNFMYYDILTKSASPEIRAKTRTLVTSLLSDESAGKAVINLELLARHEGVDAERLLEYGKLLQSSSPKAGKLFSVIGKEHMVRYMSEVGDTAKKARCVSLMREVCDEGVIELYEAYVKE